MPGFSFHSLPAFHEGPGIDEPILMETGGQKYYYHSNALGSVVALSDQSGEIAESYRYTPFGQVQDAGSLGNPYLFTGRRYDAETGEVALESTSP